MSPAFPSAKPRILPPWLTALLLVMALAGLAMAYSATRTHAEVEVTHPEYSDIASTVSTTGEVVPVDDFPAKANFSGLVDRIYVHLGQTVRTGQNLIRMKDQYAVPRLARARAELDQEELNEQNVLHNGSRQERVAAEMDLQKAEFEERQAQQSLQTVRQLVTGGDVSPAEVEAAQERLTTADASLKALRQKLNALYGPQELATQKALVNADEATLAAERVYWFAVWECKMEIPVSFCANSSLARESGMRYSGCHANDSFCSAGIPQEFPRTLGVRKRGIKPPKPGKGLWNRRASG